MGTRLPIKRMIIGIIGSDLSEVSLLLSKTKIKKKITISDIPFFIGILEGIPVVICISKQGTVNAGLASCLLIQKFKASKIIFNGAGGSLVEDLNFRDVVISSGCLFWNVNYTPIGVPISQYPSLKLSVYKANKKLIKLAENVKNIDFNTHIGKILTSNVFLANTKLRDKLRIKFNGLCAETEGAAVGQIAFLNHIPYVVYRGISDFSNENSPEDIEKFGVLASQNAQKVTLGVLSQLYCQNKLNIVDFN